MSADEEASKKNMPPVDLSLAVNYLPAVACVVKTLWISCTLALVGPGHELGAFSIVQLMLNLDAVVSGERIFNGNAVLCTVLFSWFVNFLRQGMEHAPMMGNAICVVWMLFSLVMLLEPNYLRGYISLDPSPRLGWGESGSVPLRSSQARYWRYAPLLIHTLFVGLLFFVGMSLEPVWLRVMRSIGFSVLCVVWVYVVGVWQRCCASGQNLFTRNLIGRFCPVLFVFPALALVFSLVCVVALVCLYVDIHGGGMRCMLLSACYGDNRGEYRTGYSEGEYGCEQGVDDAELLRASKGSERQFAFSDKSRAVKQLDFGKGDVDSEMEYVGGPNEMGINTIEEGEEEEEDLEACFRNALDERRCIQPSN